MIKYITGLFFLLISFTSAQTCKGQTLNDDNEKTGIALYKQDFMIFRDSLEKVHPALYRYTDKNRMNKLFDSCYASIKTDITAMQFYMLLKFMTSAVEDGHLICSLPKETIQTQLANSTLFPLRLWFIGNKAYIYCDKNNQFQPGTEILSIDDKPIQKLKEKLFSYLTSDGKIESKKYWAFNSGEASFNFLYYWLEGEKNTFTIKIKTATGQIQTASVIARVVKNDDCLFEKKPVDKYLSLDFKQNNIALLTIKTFAMGKIDQEESYFKVYLDSVFKILKTKKVAKLIIDVRDNGGGEDHNGSILYSFLTDKPFAYYASLSTVSEQLSKEVHSNLGIQQPNENNFKGNCYFLINGKSFSTTSEFTAIAKSNNRGVFIGEETGGGYYGNTGSEQAIFSLPYSKIKMIIPKRKYVLAVKKSAYKDRGTIPDHIIIPNINDVLGNNDVQLKYALKLADKK